MEGREVSLPEVLDFREEKVRIQAEMQRKYPDGTVISLGLNIPGPVKSGEAFYRAFCEGQDRLEEILSGFGRIREMQVLRKNAGYAAVYAVCGVQALDLKRKTVVLEENHPLGRIFDIDILGQDGTAVSREQIQAGRRKCLICDGDAKVCGRSRTHTVQELQNKVFAIIRAWEEQGKPAKRTESKSEKRNGAESLAAGVGAKARRALFEEIYTTPKPGLVDLYSNGAHTDMDVHTFEKSAEVLWPYFGSMAAKGYLLDAGPEDLFRDIRVTGMEAERAMYRATGGVNTHKGLIFTMGIFSAAAGRCMRVSGQITPEGLLDAEQQMTARILTEELAGLRSREAASNGERNLKLYGSAGIRGEAILGYPAVWELALPVLRRGIEENREWNRVKLQTLFTLMSKVEDSNILSRWNPETLELVHREAENFLRQGGAYAPDALTKLQKMDADYIRRRISAGGCADLLAVSIFIGLLLGYME